MTMTAALVERIKAQAEAERARRAHPDAFPPLPPVPAGRYSDPEFARLERDAVFGRSWLMVAHRDELPAPGDYRPVDQLAVPVVLVHDADGAVRAFHNTCKHRGAALVTEPAGHAGRRLTCPYHSWTYDLDGRLAGYPDAHNFADLDPACLGLSAVRCETWGPLVFVNLDDTAPPLRDALRPVSDELDELGGLVGRLRLVTRTSLDVDANWKLPVDANIETYHVNTVHRASAARALDQAATAITLLPNGHSRMLIAFRDGVTTEGSLPFPPLFHGVGDLPDRGTFSYHLFPNLSIVFFGRGFVFFITNWPTAPNRSRYDVHWCSSLAPGDGDGDGVNQQFAELNRAVLLEDLAVLPGMQRSLDAGTLDALRLSYQERRIYHLHETIDRVVGVERVPPALRVTPVLADHLEA